MDDTGIKDRFRMIMERENLTDGAFAKSINVAQATISHILGSRNKYPSTEVILRLHKRYSDINLEWLLTGKGNMSNIPSYNSQMTAKDDYADCPLFAEKAENPPAVQVEMKKSKERPIESPRNDTKNIGEQNVMHKERPLKKITEIRIFFDDNTYEIFKPEHS